MCLHKNIQRLPPLSTDPQRCELAFVGNTIGQANGVYDKAIDLRFCDFTNEKANLKGKSLAAALMSEAKFDGADMTEVVMSKAYAAGASFKGTNCVSSLISFECTYKIKIWFKRERVQTLFLCFLQVQTSRMQF